MKKKVFLLSALLVLIFILFGAYWATYGKYIPIKVLWLPKGYINLQEATDDTKGILTYEFFETYVFLVDINGTSVDQAPACDPGFIIDYKGEYFINAERYNAALEKAIKNSEQ